MIERTGRFETPWARRERNMQNLQRAFVSVADLMTSVRDNLEKQSQRQDELLQYLSHLPAAIQAIPESNRVQGETLKAIYQQLAHQNEQQDRLAEILEKLHDAGGAQKEVAEEIRERVETLNDHNQRISETLHGVGSAMQSVSKASNTSAEVLQSLQETISHRDAELERVLHKQNTRFTTMLTIAILLSVAALTAVVIMGYLMMSRMGKI
jgi:DNA repair ATPase RecN